MAWVLYAARQENAIDQTLLYDEEAIRVLDILGALEVWQYILTFLLLAMIIKNGQILHTWSLKGAQSLLELQVKQLLRWSIVAYYLV